MKKLRLDQLVFDQGLSESRERAKAIIMSGVVYVNGQRADKPGAQVAPDVNIEVRGNTLRYVSRGGLKLEKAMQLFRSSSKTPYVWSSAHLRAALRTACCKTAPPKYTA